ncbi:J domain-containing protein required for chloroplast accumulation response 1-like [Andrographis paniculata]|uniref:J domain-containing protein required for chloroplast accumulation response 1-like n=1 Tax=Andrographis paniculata TaxID=175694 RepID=UPI0021E6FC8E|nr:J domain-containing protein required for chloroplast accumulation response 1-like [Andrographis paniculata]
MDESWRRRFGMQAHLVTDYPPRRSAEEAISDRRKSVPEDDCLDPEDFSDVFGGPPRTVLSRQFSARGFPTRSSSTTTFFYEEIFRPCQKTATVERKSGRSLPQFRIPGEQRRRIHDQRGRELSGFYSDIFGWEEGQHRAVRSRSRSMASSSSVLSSEDLSPLRPAVYIDDEDEISMFAPKLRPINVKSRWNWERTGSEYAGNEPIHKSEIDNMESLRTCNYRRNASPETISLDPISNGSFRASAKNSKLNSPPSAVSLVSQYEDQKTDDEIHEEQIPMQDADELEEEDESLSSYVIEINSDNREGTCESNAVDEAIAWAKERFQTVQECEKENTSKENFKGGHTDSFRSSDEQQHDILAVEEVTTQLESMVQSEMQILDEKIRLWSTGKERDIRLLLSSLHHILWANSGWVPVPLTNIIEISLVKKAYQKARLCLHPDKLEQRAATLAQKFIAERAFSILQDAWASFISQDVLCG